MTIRQPPNPRSGFTLTELMVSIVIISILSSVTLYAMASVQQQAQVQRTKAQISRIHELIMEKWESYDSRRLPLTGLSPEERLIGTRELMRFEMPDAPTDIVLHQNAGSNPIGNAFPLNVQFLPFDAISPRPTVVLTDRPTESRYYLAKVAAAQALLDAEGQGRTWFQTHESAECLYMILSRIEVGDESALEMFSETEIGDADNDSLPEIHDAWGSPISFYRWPAGFASPLQTLNPVDGTDVFDFANVDNYDRDGDGVADQPWALVPLIVSAGPDKSYGLISPSAFNHSFSVAIVPRPSDPYAITQSGFRVGQIANPADPNQPTRDNISNHLIETSIK